MPGASEWRAGYELVVTMDGEQYPFASIDYAVSARQIDRSNSKYAPGFEITKPGSKKLTFSADGPYHEDELPLEAGEEYEMVYQPFGTHVGFAFLGGLVDLKHTNNVNDGPNVSITVVNTDTFEVVFE